MNSITWKKQICKIIVLSAFITLIGGFFLPSLLYADTAAVWSLDSSGALVSGKSYTATGFLAQSYHRNSDGTATLLWTRTGKAAVWFLNSSGAYTGSKTYAAGGFAAQCYHRYSDGTATLLWTRTGKAAVWFLNSSGAYTGSKIYAASDFLATSYVRYSDGTATLLWTKPGKAAVWFLNSSGAYTGSKIYAASGWNAKDYVRNSDGTASLLWGKYGKASVWFLNSSGAYTGSKGYSASGWAATSYMGSGAVGAMKISSTKSTSDGDVSFITVQKAGSGAGTITVGTQVCETICKELFVPYIEGDQIDVNVTPAADSYFAGWETVDGEPLGDIYYANPGDTVIAVFEKK